MIQMEKQKDASERIIVALDRSPFRENLPLIEQLKDRARWVKIGLRSILADGPGVMEKPNELGYRIFLDIKLHDIPTTVAEALGNLIPYGFDMVTLHVAGGRNMLEACRKKVDEADTSRKPLLLGVTLLTSLDRTDIRDLGVMYSVAGQVKRLAEVAQQSGCDGVIASGGEVKVVRNACGDDFVIVTPGIRPGAVAEPGSDQRRVMSPGEAVGLGSDYLVIGRPIYAADDPVEAFDRIVDEINRAGSPK
jgi:orotidine-5'-phosphate decarboxylase